MTKQPSTIHQVFDTYGGPEAACDRFEALIDARRPLSADERIERYVLGACFSDLRRVIERADDLVRL